MQVAIIIGVIIVVVAVDFVTWKERNHGKDS
jgi:hypothetical protein